MCVLYRRPRPNVGGKKEVLSAACAMATQHADRNPEHGVGPVAEDDGTQGAPEADFNDSWQRFRIIGMVAKIVQRWQASINPKVDFRKRNSPVKELPARSQRASGTSGNRRVLSEPVPEPQRHLLGRNRSASQGRGVAGSGPPVTATSMRKTRANRGHMTSYLFQPLPEPRHKREESG